MRKKWRNMIFILAIMTVCFLVGCGKSEGDVETKSTEQSTEEKLTLNSGCWVVESMTMDGTEFKAEDLKKIFGEPETVMALEFTSTGVVNGFIFDDHFTVPYKGELNDFEIVFATDEVTKGTYSEDKKMVLTQQDGSKMTLVHQEEVVEALLANPWRTYEVDFSDEQTCTMSNFMMWGRYLIEDNVLYGLTHSKNLNGSLGATPIYMKGDFPEFEETVILDDRGAATYLNKIGDILYYIMNSEEICRINVDGSGLEVLYKGACDYLQIRDDRIYFADENYHFVSMDMNGKNLVTVVDKEIYYPYFISSDWMVFQDDADSESLHLCNTTYGEELNLTNGVSHAPVLHGKYLYYVDASDGNNYLSRIDMSDPDELACEKSENTISMLDYMIDGKTIYLPNNTSMELERWKEAATSDSVEKVMELYVSEEYTVYHKFDKDGLISEKYLMSVIKFGGSPFK